MEYYSAMTHAITWTNLENILSEGRWSQKATYGMIPFIFKSRIGKSIANR